MQLQKFTGRELEGVIFDGSFESTAEIVNFLTDKDNLRGGNKVQKFTIQHNRLSTKDYQAFITFIVDPVSGDPNAQPREFTVRCGDFLHSLTGALKVIPKEMLRDYWEPEV